MLVEAGRRRRDAEVSRPRGVRPEVRVETKYPANTRLVLARRYSPRSWQAPLTTAERGSDKADGSSPVDSLGLGHEQCHV